MTASQIFDAIAPSFATDPAKATFLELALSRIRSCYYGSNANMAQALLSAHMMVLRDRGITGDTGFISSKAEGALSISYGGVVGISGDLSQTHYGVQLQALKRESNAGGISVTGQNDNGCDSSLSDELEYYP